MKAHTVRILCVDDDIDGCEMISELLSTHDPSFRVDCTHSASEALAAVALKEYDVFIVDNWLPRRSGIELCREIRLTNSSVPIIIYSAVAHKADVEEGIAAGADAYLLKPNDVVNLGSTIDKLLSSRGGKMMAI